MKNFVWPCFLLSVLALSEGNLREPVGCQNDEFLCYNGECIQKLQWCDAVKNCRDGSDEKYCQRAKPSGQDPNLCRNETSLFLCLDGMCIPKVGLCDGLKTCRDNSDETNCTSQLYSDIDIKDFSGSLHMDKTQNKPLLLYRYVGESSSYKDLPYQTYSELLESARDWLKSQQKENFGWGDYTARAVTAMYLSKKELSKTHEDLLMDKQLDIELSIALTRNETEPISISELALYINALLASCKNPRNFYGYDLVNILRERADEHYLSAKFASPFIHLTLCLSNATIFEDVKSLQGIFKYHQNIPNKVDIISLAVLASSCIIKTPLYAHPKFRRNIVEALLNKIKSVGLPGNIYELSLVMQALNEAKVDPLEWGRSEAIDFILNQQKNGSFGNVLATYYTMPILSGRSLLSLSDHCSQDFSNGKTPLAVLKNVRRRKINVFYSLRFGEPVDMTQKLQLQVAEGTNFLDIMRIAQEENPNFRFNLDDTKSIPFVYTIGGIPNDAERGLYWTLHLQTYQTPGVFYPYNKDIKDLIPKENEEIIFWLKQM